MNFTWFASSYDTDVVPYRLLTLAQTAGVLVLAAGGTVGGRPLRLPRGRVGYLIMRTGLVAQWGRAGLEDPGSRRTALRYAVATASPRAGNSPTAGATVTTRYSAQWRPSVPGWMSRSSRPREAVILLVPLTTPWTGTAVTIAVLTSVCVLLTAVSTVLQTRTRTRTQARTERV